MAFIEMQVTGMYIKGVSFSKYAFFEKLLCYILSSSFCHLCCSFAVMFVRFLSINSLLWADCPCYLEVIKMKT